MEVARAAQAVGAGGLTSWLAASPSQSRILSLNPSAALGIDRGLVADAQFDGIEAAGHRQLIHRRLESMTTGTPTGTCRAESSPSRRICPQTTTSRPSTNVRTRSTMTFAVEMLVLAPESMVM